MTFEYSWLAYPGLDNRYVDAGFILRDKRGRISFKPLPNFEAVTSDIQAGATQAEAEGHSTDFWDYMMERGMGGHSSFSEPAKVEAATPEEAVAVILRQRGSVQHVSEE